MTKIVLILITCKSPSLVVIVLTRCITMYIPDLLTPQIVRLFIVMT